MSDGLTPHDAGKNERLVVKEGQIAVEVSGKDPVVWTKRKLRFYQRIFNSIRKIFESDIPPAATADTELKTLSDLLAASAFESIKTPVLKNVERQAAIKLMLAEAREKEAAAKEREANARKLHLEADLIELEMETKKVLESQRILDLAIQRGELTVIEKDGETLFIVCDKRNLE